MDVNVSLAPATLYRLEGLFKFEGEFNVSDSDTSKLVEFLENGSKNDCYENGRSVQIYDGFCQSFTVTNGQNARKQIPRDVKKLIRQTPSSLKNSSAGTLTYDQIIYGNVSNIHYTFGLKAKDASGRLTSMGGYSNGSVLSSKDIKIDLFFENFNIARVVPILNPPAYAYYSVGPLTLFQTIIHEATHNYFKGLVLAGKISKTNLDPDIMEYNASVAERDALVNAKKHNTVKLDGSGVMFRNLSKSGKHVYLTDRFKDNKKVSVASDSDMYDLAIAEVDKTITKLRDSLVARNFIGVPSKNVLYYAK